MSIRDNLLVTIGIRAAYMDVRGDIELPTGSTGEDILAEFASELVEAWFKLEPDIGFDEYIETALLNQFSKEK